jgi:predicted transcriptional regulator
MAASRSNLRVLDSTAVAKELDLVSELFHRINRIIPEDQQILTVLPTCRVRDAVELMQKHGYSQVPVVSNGEVLGVFSFRSFATGAARANLDEWNKERIAPGDLTVDEFVEQFEFARVTEEPNRAFDAMDRDNGILIGTPERLIGILTPMDVLRYLYEVASPFVMISEIELALRALIRSTLNKGEMVAASKRCLAPAYGGEDKVPTCLEDMTFDNYQVLIGHGDNWPSFEPLFGASRVRTTAKLKEIGAIRNDLFHFKRQIKPEDRETLATHRDWLLNKVKQVEANRKDEVNP